MLATLMTALFFMVKALGQLGNSLYQEEPLPYLVHQPLPWQVQCVTQSRRTSRDSEKGGRSRHNSLYGITGRKGGEASPAPSPVPSSGAEELGEPVETSAVTVQMHCCEHQQTRGK
ncbi:hypothetical protein JRQ81_010599 [Phrynocephalus forsythii]|uniref:Uncharacterized protein n=1 Tax=Phrynocephalus forsythii TaxID=171643 RepID=A0A9Q1AQQ1_9SAUR|nr:hypothetical protein JRQ81_010599 [Phrynocephalus forsythii]